MKQKKGREAVLMSDASEIKAKRSREKHKYDIKTKRIYIKRHKDYIPK